MKVTPTFRQIFNLTYKLSVGGALVFTLMFSFSIYLLGLEKIAFDITRLPEFFEKSNELWIVGVLLFLIFIWGFVIFSMGTYLMYTSFVISKRYGRFLLVLSALFFFFGVFHLIPFSDINESYRWFTHVYIRFMQGISSTSMLLTTYGLIQGIVIFILGRDE
jgi:hypothetical protein